MAEFTWKQLEQFAAIAFSVWEYDTETGWRREHHEVAAASEDGETWLEAIERHGFKPTEFGDDVSMWYRVTDDAVEEFLVEVKLSGPLAKYVLVRELPNLVALLKELRAAGLR